MKKRVPIVPKEEGPKVPRRKKKKKRPRTFMCVHLYTRVCVCVCLCSENKPPKELQMSAVQPPGCLPTQFLLPPPPPHLLFFGVPFFFTYIYKNLFSPPLPS